MPGSWIAADSWTWFDKTTPRLGFQLMKMWIFPHNLWLGPKLFQVKYDIIGTCINRLLGPTVILYKVILGQTWEVFCLLPSQVRFPDMKRAKYWAAEVCSRETVYSQGNQARNKSEICLLESEGVGIFRRYQQCGLRLRERCLEVGKRWGHWSSIQAYLSYMLLHGMNVLIFGPVLSKGHPSDISTGPVLGSVVPTSLSQLSMNWTQLTSSSQKIPSENICLG